MRTGIRKYIRPEALWRPGLVVSRRALAREAAPGSTVVCEMPWGSKLEVQPDEYIGSVILTWLVFELGVCELLARLVEPGEVAIDIGANIGQMSSLLAAHVGPDGRVLAFEPHPVTFRRLSANRDRWVEQGGHAQTVLFPCALGPEPGTAFLKEEPNFSVNPGLSSLVGSSEASPAHEVEVRRLDDLVEARVPVGVLKIDVEDFELQVLKGATSILAAGTVRDIVFEDHEGYPSHLSSFLEQYGYRVFTMRRELLGPVLVKCEGQVTGNHNFLATRDADRAVSKFEGKGYAALKSRVR